MRRVILATSCFRNGDLDSVVLAFCRLCSADESAGREFIGVWNPVASSDASPLAGALKIGDGDIFPFCIKPSLEEVHLDDLGRC